MENISFAHVGGELVLIGGIAFYFHRKTNLLQGEITSLKEENKELNDTIEELKDGLQQLATMVMQMQSQHYPQTVHQARPVPQPQPQPVPQPIPAQRQPQGRPIGMRRRQPVRQQAPVPQQQAPVRQKAREPFTKVGREDSEDSGDDTYEDGDLDNELVDEYKQLEKDRDCDGDQCQLVD